MSDEVYFQHTDKHHCLLQVGIKVAIQVGIKKKILFREKIR